MAAAGMIQTHKQTARQAARDIAAGVRSAREVVAAALARLDALEPTLNACIDTFHEPALAQADHVDARRAAGRPLGPMAGVPIVAKDNLCLGQDTYPGRTTCASRMLEHYRSPYTATALQKMLDAGAIVIAKANLDEFAMGASGEHSAFGPTANPWDPARTPGGSSSGSAAAVAAGLVPVALGSDTGGSVRQPAAMTGLVGLKPTYGRVSRYGLVAYASSLDQVGTLTHTVADAALALTIIAGHDPLDATSAPHPIDDYAAAPGQPIAGWSVALVEPAGPVHPAVADALERAARALSASGVRVSQGHLPHTALGVAAYYLIAPAEASSNLARYDGVRYGHRAALAPGEGLQALYTRSRTEGFGPEVRKRILLGTHALQSGYHDRYYGRAQRTRRLIQNDFTALFADGIRAVLMPTTPGPAFRLGEKLADPMALYLEDAFTVGANLAGLPAIGVPMGLTPPHPSHKHTPLPIGVQLIGRPYDEAGLLALAQALEAAQGPTSPTTPTTHGNP
ncbi:MAG: Asp-tRNA(Asn)/Glu-tRNA(Gln) amidotransferase subunit GatA [Phycisphaeraceae bacterium]|nr:Asp-tRNA(Asn)/Glu-tRNA(Gln) amidotransferase subunit GatA [Phycisphaeraceae bacterium]